VIDLSVILSALVIGAMIASPTSGAPARSGAGGAQVEAATSRELGGGEAASARAFARLPWPARAAVSSVLGREDRGFRAVASAGGVGIENRRHGFKARFGPQGVELHAGEARLDLALRAAGYGDSLLPVGAAVLRAEANRVEYRRDGLIEWYVNGPLGLEQSFTLEAPPAGRGAGPLTLALSLSGTLEPRLERGGKGITFTSRAGPSTLAYRGLTVSDARGRSLPAWLDLQGTSLLVRVDDAGAHYPVTIDPFFQAAKLTASDATPVDRFGGFSVAVSGDTIVVGNPFDELAADIGTNANQGSVYVFVKPAGGWANATETAKLTASDGTRDDRLGWSVGISGDTIVAGAPTTFVHSTVFPEGAAYVFVKPAGGWANATETAKLTASDRFFSNALQFGQSVAIEGDTIVAGAPNAFINLSVGGLGLTYVFVKPAGGWASATETAKLSVADLSGFHMGFSVAIAGDTVVAGAPTNAFSTGAAYVFMKPAGGWAGGTETAKLTASDGHSADLFGQSVAIEGDTIVAGAPGEVFGDYEPPGAAYVFVKPAGGWADATEAAKLTASDGAALDGLGYAVAVSGLRVVAGAPFSGVFATGAAYVFAKPAGGWTDATEAAKLTAANASNGDVFGRSVASFADTVVVGTLDGDSAYVFVSDSVPPFTVISLSPRFPQGDDDWYLTDVHVIVTAFDTGGSPVAETRCVLDPVSRAVPASFDALPAGCPYTGAGADVTSQGRHTLYAASKDLAGNEETPKSLSFKIDMTHPTASIALAPATPNGQNGWYVSSVHVTVASADAAGGSGVGETRCVLDPAAAPASFGDLPAGCSYTGAGADVTSDGQHTLYFASKDVAGNTEAPKNVSFKIDRTAPTVTCDATPTFVLRGAGGSVSASVTDAASGPAASPITAAADVSSAGGKSLALMGSDLAGNPTTVSCAYIVAYNLLGPFSPFPLPRYQAGATIALRFALADASGARIPDAEAQALASACKVTVRFDAGTPACAEYNRSSDTFRLNVMIAQTTTQGTHTMTIGVFVGADLVNTKTVTVNIES